MNVPYIEIKTPDSFSFEQNVSYLLRSANECMYRVEGEFVEGERTKGDKIKGSSVYKALLVGGQRAVMKVSGKERGSLLLELKGGEVGGSISEELKAEAVAYVKEWFDLERDLSPFYEMAAEDPLLKEPAVQFRGLRLMGIPDLFESLCWGIIGQQINLAYAYTLKRRFVESYGKAVESDGGIHWLFPEPERIAALTPVEMEPLRMTVKKCEYLIGAAQAVASGALTKPRLREAGGLKEAEKLLTGMRGIGPWTANYAIMRCLLLPDAFPIDDVGLHNAIKFQLGMDRKPSKAELLKLSEGWVGWQAYATFYLWRLLY
ncbi:DNA-3-methyladenine glycosylase family protein [Paenibacillus sp. GCM10027627]|uniref:DNA-3-methyladenine glycosylase family protein n=1 Tax=unclassified Paenibacillus TaxID=185978 RepID=UPI003637977A